MNKQKIIKIHMGAERNRVKGPEMGAGLVCVSLFMQL